MSIDHRQLRFFEEVARCKSINRAAKVLHISQSALSRRMSALEHDMGTSLFIRSTRGITLTDSGQRLLKHATRLGESLQELALDDRTGAMTQPATIRIGVLSGMSAMLMPHVASLHSAEKKAALFESSTAVLRQGVRGGQLDLAIVGNPQADESLEFTPIWKEQLALVYPRRRDLSQLDNLPFLMPSEDDYLTELISAALRGSGLVVNEIMTVTPTDLARQMVEMGLGYTILHHSALVGSHSSLQIHPLPHANVVLGIATRKKAVREGVGAMMKIMQAALVSEVRKMNGAFIKVCPHALAAA